MASIKDLTDEDRAEATRTPEYQEAMAAWRSAHDVYKAANADLRKQRAALNRAFTSAARKIVKAKWNCPECYYVNKTTSAACEQCGMPFG